MLQDAYAILACALSLAMCVVVVYFLVTGRHDRDKEEEARVYFDEHGHWPDEAWSPLKNPGTPPAAHPRLLAPPTRLTWQSHASLLACGPRHPRLHHVGRTAHSSTDS